MPGGKNIYNRKNHGYTIVEVMIVLAISGVMFVMAAGFINGRQAKTAFNTGSNQIGSEAQSLIGQVTDGRYSDIKLTCGLNATGTKLNIAIGSNEQGKNDACVFLGKMFRFRLNTSDYQTLSIAGLRKYDSTNPALTASKPTVIGSLTVSKTTPQSLNVVCVKIKKTITTPATNCSDAINNFGFMQGLGTFDDKGNYNPGSQNISLVFADTTSYTNDDLISQNIQQAVAASICLSDNTRYAQIDVGSEDNTNKNQLQVVVKQLGNTSCAT